MLTSLSNWRTSTWRIKTTTFKRMTGYTSLIASLINWIEIASNLWMYQSKLFNHGMTPCVRYPYPLWVIPREGVEPSDTAKADQAQLFSWVSIRDTEVHHVCMLILRPIMGAALSCSSNIKTCYKHLSSTCIKAKNDSSNDKTFDRHGVEVSHPQWTAMTSGGVAPPTWLWSSNLPMRLKEVSCNTWSSHILDASRSFAVNSLNSCFSTWDQGLFLQRISERT